MIILDIISNVSFLKCKQEGNTADHPDGKIPHTAPVFVLNFDSVVGEFSRLATSFYDCSVFLRTVMRPEGVGPR